MEHALALLLRNTPFFVKRTTDGSFLITARPLADVLPVPEIIVTARRSPDHDIRRTVNDVHPQPPVARVAKALEALSRRSGY